MNNDRESTRYPIAAVRERLRRQAGPVLDFAVGQHRDRLPAAVEQLIAGGGDGSLINSCSQREIERFAEAAARMLDRVYGIEIAPSAVLAVPGGRTAMSFMAATLIRPGDQVAIVEPAYPALTRVVTQIHARVRIVPLDPDREFAPDRQALGRDLEEISFAALNFPNNPTGAVLSSQPLAEFLGALDQGTTVFNDATYGPLVFDRPPWSLLAEGRSQAERLRFVELHSLAKLFGVGPLAVSFLVGDEEIMAELREFSEYAWSDQSSLQIQVATRCLEDGERFAEVREIYSQRLATLREVLGELGFEPFPAASGMYCVCRTPSAIGGRSVTSSDHAAELLLQMYGLAVVPWEVHPTSYLRFSARYVESDLEALANLGSSGPIATP